MNFLLTAIGGMIGAATVLAIAFSWLNLPAYQTLIGALIALAATLGAALIAWFAVQKQIEISERKHNEQRISEINRRLADIRVIATKARQYYKTYIGFHEEVKAWQQPGMGNLQVRSTEFAALRLRKAYSEIHTAPNLTIEMIICVKNCDEKTGALSRFVKDIQWDTMRVMDITVLLNSCYAFLLGTKAVYKDLRKVAARETLSLRRERAMLRSKAIR